MFEASAQRPSVHGLTFRQAISLLRNETVASFGAKLGMLSTVSWMARGYWPRRESIITAICDALGITRAELSDLVAASLKDVIAAN